jgi:hypothetical protein
MLRRFVARTRGGERAAAMYSILLQTPKLNGVNLPRPALSNIGAG